jgi:hypothetical protein
MVIKPMQNVPPADRSGTQITELFCVWHVNTNTTFIQQIGVSIPAQFRCYLRNYEHMGDVFVAQGGLVLVRYTVRVLDKQAVRGVMERSHGTGNGLVTFGGLTSYQGK